MTRSSLVKRAREFAESAHRAIDHRRKYSREPYAVHLEAVAELVASVTEDPVLIAAAWLHDVVEDTPVTLKDVDGAFGEEIAELVAELTDVSTLADGNRKDRKAIDRQHLAGASASAKTIKLADLINNCTDITRHDPHFARTYLAEMRALLEVLREGHPGLYRMAEETHRSCVGIIEAGAGGAAAVRVHDQALYLRMKRLFNEGFMAMDIATPLLSFDADRELSTVLSFMEERNLSALGVREDGGITGFMTDDLIPGETCADAKRPFTPEQIVPETAPLAAVISVLAEQSYCFVSVLGGVSAVITRDDLLKPPVRMWLFGMVTILESFGTRAIEEHFPGESWREILSPGRLRKAEELLAERMRRGQHPRLLDCLQISDKADVLMKDPAWRRDFGYRSAKEAKRAMKELESLRNNLAHAQDIVSMNWEAIVRLALHVDRITTRV